MKNNKSRNYYPLYKQGKLDPQAEKILRQIEHANLEPLSSLTPQQARESFLNKAWLGKPKNNIRVEKLNKQNSTCPIPIRIYKPEKNQQYPVLVFLHGGGFVLGKMDEFDPFCKFLADGASCCVISIDYRLAPEHKHPAAVEDVVTALKWIAKNIDSLQGDPERIAIAGDSAGGNLATVSSIIARDEGFINLIYQILICPWIDLSSFDTDSYKYFCEGLWLSTENIHWYRNHYVKNYEQAKSPLVSPILTRNLSGLPPALVLTAEFDVIRDEGEAYANRLKKDGVQVQCVRYQGMLHDFIILPGIFDKAWEAIDTICKILKIAFFINK